mmetsp:Transcript_98449/g.312344  ORF Transcript_98449/g.312344 Transcript_98449/m.312344 type:complete len:306 (+) Transcript_98449:1012-1929(+)
MHRHGGLLRLCSARQLRELPPHGPLLHVPRLQREPHRAPRHAHRPLRSGDHRLERALQGLRRERRRSRPERGRDDAVGQRHGRHTHGGPLPPREGRGLLQGHDHGQRAELPGREQQHDGAQRACAPGCGAPGVEGCQLPHLHGGEPGPDRERPPGQRHHRAGRCDQAPEPLGRKHRPKRSLHCPAELQERARGGGRPRRPRQHRQGLLPAVGGSARPHASPPPVVRDHGEPGRRGRIVLLPWEDQVPHLHGDRGGGQRRPPRRRQLLQHQRHERAPNHLGREAGGGAPEVRRPADTLVPRARRPR